jgi:hypothetical protein
MQLSTTGPSSLVGHQCVAEEKLFAPGFSQSKGVNNFNSLLSFG